MQIKINYIVRFFVIIPFIIAILAIGIFIGLYYSKKGQEIIPTNILGIFFPTQTPTPSPTIPPPTATPIEYKISFDDLPKEIVEGEQATFTWSLGGPSITIHKTAIYFGTASIIRVGKETAPVETKYTEAVKDFIEGNYTIPLRFVGNASVLKQGVYFARAYALIEGKNYWSDERTFKVNPAPKNQIRIINYPEKVKLGENSTFTWEVTGPQTTTNFTAIVGSKQSKSEALNESVDLTKTPYIVLTKDFTGGSQNVPLRFIGNAVMPEYGIYYIRALTVISGKNIWSDEHTLTVQ
ncbi:hypothetical protein A2Y99_05235 [Candidatus Gottesmanbacteria bacterium RBG_13_37_7]|uniref:Uncharacterized protein n=1 Tax=Candidatus Gottesmanbacteria bacterium RBG_13_37_7 TaxID=1798369 RepID=A0A1F5YKF1_9BACT|nr:MAG: hypothetical protein A2Y99_05235 [Candidatus Gottesmanbacteria bacterium RBG_13_37_7]